MSDAQQNALVARVLLRGKMPDDTAGASYVSQDALGRTLDLLFAAMHDSFPGHKEAFGDQVHFLIGTRIRHERGPAQWSGPTLDVTYLRGEIFLEYVRASDVCYAFCATYGPLWGVPIPEYAAIPQPTTMIHQEEAEPTHTEEAR